MIVLTLTMPHDASRLHFHTTRQQARPRFSAECKNGPPCRNGRVTNPRQIVGEALHPQAMQIDIDDLPCKTPAPGYVYLEYLGFGSSHRRPVVVGVGEDMNSARRHLDLPSGDFDACA